MRRTLVTCIVIVAGLAPASAAHAGGSWIAPTEPAGWSPVGAVVSMRGTFCDGQLAPVSAGPWFAYLETSTREPMLLGSVDVSAADDNGCAYLARTTFVVPEVAPGHYWIRVCDLGCRQRVGALVGWQLMVAASGLEARLITRVDRYHEMMPRLRERVREGQITAERLVAARQARDEALVTLAALEAANDRLTSQRDVALDGREVAEAEVRAADRRARNWRIAASVLALLVAGTWAVAWARRKDTVRIKIPNTVEELTDPADHRADR